MSIQTDPQDRFCDEYNCVVSKEECPYCGEVHPTVESLKYE